MSEPITGADLEQLDALAATYATAGTQVAASAGELRTRIERAVAAFAATMARLQQQATTLAAALDDEISAVSAHAGGVAWTGANRAAFDAGLQRFDGQVRAGSAAIVDGVHELRVAVDTRFAPVLEEFAGAVTAAGDGVETATGEVGAAVAQQRSALEQTANVGWMSA